MKIIFSIIISFSSSQLLFAQITNVQGVSNELMRVKKYDDIKGDPYLYINWNSGTITDKAGKVTSNVIMKYDTYKDKVEINKDGVVMEIDPSLYPGFTFNFADPATNEVIKHFFSSGYDIPGYSPTSYFDLLYDGKWKVLKKYKTMLIDGNVPGYGTSAPQREFQPKVFYFVKDENAVIREVKLSKKSVLDTFKEREVEIEKFLKESRLKLKTERDLLSLIKFIER